MTGGGSGDSHKLPGVMQHNGADVTTQQKTKHLYNICTMLDQRRRRWAGVVQMLYKCFVSVGHSKKSFS